MPHESATPVSEGFRKRRAGRTGRPDNAPGGREPSQRMLEMQRRFGNQATGELVGRTGGDPGALLDPATAAREARQDGLGAKPAQPVQLAQVTSLAEIDALDPETIQRMDPTSLDPYRLLHDVFHQSWHEAKHALIGTQHPNREPLMLKLWEYRQWHHEQVLKATQAEVNATTKGDGGLKKWVAAGSTTLTSDIDVNLKGSQTELAVAVYNRLFRQGAVPGHTWDVESGVAYDVNVYALDFMHAFTFSDASKTEDGSRITGKEGARPDREQGGFAETAIGRRDTGDQHIWSLVKMRLYMTDTQWSEYKVRAGLKDDHDTLTQVERRYAEYADTLQTKMVEESGFPVAETSAWIKQSVAFEATGIKQIDRAATLLAEKKRAAGAALAKDTMAEEAKMSASNRLYEERLVEIKRVRIDLEDRLERYNAAKAGPKPKGAPASEQDLMRGGVEMGLRQLRRLLSEASLFSNEAYLTDAAVNHAVVGIQGGMPVKQSKGEAMIAVNENVADALKEIARHGGGGGPDKLGEAAYKSSKYVFRMADAAKNLGYGTLPGIQELYDAGYDISVTLKSAGGTDVEAQSAVAITQHLGQDVTTPDELVAAILAAGTAVAQAFEQVKGAQRNASAQTMPSGKNVRNDNR